VTYDKDSETYRLQKGWEQSELQKVLMDLIPIAEAELFKEVNGRIKKCCQLFARDIEGQAQRKNAHIVGGEREYVLGKLARTVRSCKDICDRAHDAYDGTNDRIVSVPSQYYSSRDIPEDLPPTHGEVSTVARELLTWIASLSGKKGKFNFTTPELGELKSLEELCSIDKLSRSLFLIQSRLMRL
jgi:hypothetical protein